MNLRPLLAALSVAAVAAGGHGLVGSGAETRPEAAPAPAAQSGTADDVHGGDASYVPTRINKAIELLERDQQIYYTQVNDGGYEEGKALAGTWADYITYNMEHSPFDMPALRARVFAATKQAGIPFLNRVRAEDIEQMIDEGVRIGSSPGAEVADHGRRYTNRRIPW